MLLELKLIFTSVNDIILKYTFEQLTEHLIISCNLSITSTYYYIHSSLHVLNFLLLSAENKMIYF